MNYLICDDEPKAAESLKQKILSIEPDAKISCYTTPEALMFNIEDMRGEIDGVFMDIKLGGANGIRGAEKLLTQRPEIGLVYITGYPAEYVQDLYCVDDSAMPAAVLVKPIETRYLKNALEKLREKGARPELFQIKSGGTISYINLSELLYITSIKRKLLITTVSGNYEIYGKISDMLGKLPGYFVRCHKSCIVNVRQISKVTGWINLEMSDGSVIPISRTYKDDIKAAVTLGCT